MGSITIGSAALTAFGRLVRQQPTDRGGAKAPARSGAPHRTGAPVLRDSLEAGTFEDSFWASPAKGETDQLLRAARKTLDAARRLRRDARAGARVLTAFEQLVVRLTGSAVRVYEEILTLARLNRGRVFPSYDHLAEATGLGRATVGRALAILESIGFVVRQRRFQRLAAEGPGPRYEQTSNVYRPLLPASVKAYLPRWMRPAPLPIDAVQHHAEQAEELDAMLKTLSCRDLARMTVGGALGKILAKLGASIDRKECEAQKGPQPLRDSYSYDGDELA